MTVPLTIVVNPTAGGGKPARYLPHVTSVLAAAGARYRLCESASLQHAQALARSAGQRGDTVVAFGGDGLTGALVDAIAEQGCAFGIIPAGNGNDFARTLRIPFDPAVAARTLLEGRPRPVDLIGVTGAGETEPTMVTGSVYVGIASVANEIANRTRVLRGPVVYNLAALRALLGWQPTTFGVQTTNAAGEQATMTFRGYAVVVANSPYFGAGMKVAPDAHADDGLLDVVIMRDSPKLTFVRVLMKIKDGSHVALPAVQAFRASQATVTVDRPLPVGADGELLPIRPPLHIRTVPGALQVIVPS